MTAQQRVLRIVHACPVNVRFKARPLLQRATRSWHILLMVLTPSRRVDPFICIPWNGVTSLSAVPNTSTFVANLHAIRSSLSTVSTGSVRSDLATLEADMDPATLGLDAAPATLPAVESAANDDLSDASAQIVSFNATLNSLLEEALPEIPSRGSHL